jgi:hypothetical protein
MRLQLLSFFAKKMNVNGLITALLITALLMFGGVSFAQPWTEDFDSGLASSYTTGSQTLTTGSWYTVVVYKESSSTSYGGTGAAARLNDDTNGASIRTPAMNTVGTVTFYYRELNSGGGTFALEKSYNGSSWTGITTQAFSGTSYTQFTYDVNDNASTIYIRVVSDDQSGHLIIDDFSVTAYSASSNDTDTEAYDSGSQPAASDISSTSTAFTNVFEIEIEDMGTSDGLVTDVTNIRVKPHSTNTADWTDHINDVKLNNGSNVTIGTPTITDTYIDIPIASGNLEISDGSSDVITLQIQINNTGITDNAILSFMVDADDHGFTADNSGV